MRIKLLFNTVRRLKPIQIYYQLRYKLKKAKSFAQFPVAAHSAIDYLHFSDALAAFACADADGNFWFLNKKKSFKDDIDWAFNDFGKLWNYNLQYANYLLQEDINLNKRLAYLNSLYGALEANKIPLEPYPVSLRAINIIRLICRKNVDDKALVNNLYRELCFLSERFEYHLLGNHLLENAFAQIMGGAFFNKPDWLTQGHKVLRAELEEQILDNGAHFELSPMYHQVILYRALELIDWYRNFNAKSVEFLDFIALKTGKMLGWLAFITFSNNEIPLFNDAAKGIAYDTQSLLAYGKRLGVSPVSSYASGPSYRMIKKELYECAVDCAQIGPSYQAGHAHADSLSFILNYKNQPLFAEAGTFTYEADKRRSYERSTAAHNTVILNNANSSEIWGSFRVGERAKTEIVEETPAKLTARHSGYKKRFGAIHQREFVFEANNIIIADNIIGANISEAKAAFHLHPDVVSAVNGNRIEIEDIGHISFAGSEKIESEKYIFADEFNIGQEALVYYIYFRETLKTQIFLKD